MILNRYKVFFLTIILIFSIKYTSYAASKDTVIEYDVTKDATEDFVDIEKTDLQINNDKQIIRLSGEDIISKLQFNDNENSPVAYSVMTGDGISQYMFDGKEMIEIDQLKVEVDNPLAYAIKPNTPDLVVAAYKEDDEKDIMYYSYGAGEMIENPYLSISGLTEIRSMTFVNENDLAVLEKNTVDIYKMAAKEMVNIPSLGIDELENPLDMASRNAHNITVLEEDKIRQFEFNGSGYSEIPSLSIYLDEDIEVRDIAVADGQISFIDNENVYTYLRSDEDFAYVKALSVTDSLESPCAIAVNKNNSKNLIVLDKEEDTAKIKYFSFTGEEMVEVPELSVDVKDILLGNAAKYAFDGELISKPLKVKGAYINLVQLGAYTYLEKDTSITFYVSQGKDSKEWLPMWKLKREKDDKGRLYRNMNFGKEGVNWKYKGGRKIIFPQNLNIDETIIEDEDDIDFEVIENEDGELQLDPSKQNDDWFETPIDLDALDNDSQYIRFKVKFESETGENTPYIYVPFEDNEIDKLNEEDDIAIKIIGRKKAESPVIDDIDDGLDNDLPGLVRKKGWVYTTTPTVKWRIPGVVESDNYQNSCQLVIMADTDDGWKPALVTNRITGEAGERQEYEIPTSERANVEGPLFDSGEYKFAAFVRVWDIDDTPSDFSVGKRFNVLAYERPRITNIISTPDGEFSNTVVIKKGMDEENLPKAKAGTAITFTVDSVGPIENDVKDGGEISKIFYLEDNEKVYINKGEVTSKNDPGSSVNRWNITFWTSASVKEVPEDTVIDAAIFGESDIGGRTVFYIPDYADGIAKIKNTVYTEWNVFLKGSERN